MLSLDNLFSVKGKVVILTGGDGYLGKSYTKMFRKAGAHVVIWDIKGKLSVDITSQEEVEKATKKVLKEYGHIDVLINNAAMNPSPEDPEAKKNFSPYEEYPLSLWRKEIDVGLTGALIVTQEVSKIMIKKGSGTIVNIGSHYGMIAPDNRIYKKGMFKSIGYSTVKGAIPNFTRAWASYLGPHGIRVNCFVPGGVFLNHNKDFVKKYSERTMLGRMARASEYDQTLLFLSSDASSYITGTTLVADGGWTAW